MYTRVLKYTFKMIDTFLQILDLFVRIIRFLFLSLYTRCVCVCVCVCGYARERAGTRNISRSKLLKKNLCATVYNDVVIK